MELSTVAKLTIHLLVTSEIRGRQAAERDDKYSDYQGQGAFGVWRVIKQSKEINASSFSDFKDSWSN